MSFDWINTQNLNPFRDLSLNNLAYTAYAIIGMKWTMRHTMPYSNSLLSIGSISSNRNQRIVDKTTAKLLLVFLGIIKMLEYANKQW